MQHNISLKELHKKRELAEFNELKDKNPEDLTLSEKDAFLRMCLVTAINDLVSSADNLIGCSDEEAEHADEIYKLADGHAMRLVHMIGDHWAYGQLIQNTRMLATLASIHSTPQARLLRRARGGESKTYIALNPLTGMIKIGRSNNPEKRMSHLITGAAVKPKLLIVIDGDVEKQLHKTFAHLRYGGEWFIDDGSIAEYIERERKK